ncbi:LysR substrate-binding domain-containing protein [Teichococcus oryzae]|uniref:LysR family transcriptional regulator n=1 Tax=Teichococcus oryzae TaxID=1608942 RepID=A0A5B2TCF9_9PROT|nr:LysR substrate-binding domain-containing protein [Pseudoroseomonas oryzae]KAA2212196.1 LysR family transcriptional regulator [Pseudoroseomonas oryzae]
MRRHVPPTAALQAFEACARHLSVSRAAEELRLTQSAVSRQLAGLEAMLGLRLFQRVRQRLVLTPAGAAYAPRVRTTLARLEGATRDLLAHRGAGGTLNIAVSPTFGTRWLVPCLPSFRAAYPGVIVNFMNYTTRLTPLDFAAEDVDAAIMLSEDAVPGVIRHRLMRDARLPVCAPAIAARLHGPADLAREVLIQQTTRPRGWVDWLDQVGAEGVDGLRGPLMQHTAMVAAACVAGLGVALLPRFLVRREIEEGLLATPFEQPLHGDAAYCLAYPEAAEDIPALRAFRDWIKNQALDA